MVLLGALLLVTVAFMLARGHASHGAHQSADLDRELQRLRSEALAAAKQAATEAYEAGVRDGIGQAMAAKARAVRSPGGFGDHVRMSLYARRNPVDTAPWDEIIACLADREASQIQVAVTGFVDFQRAQLVERLEHAGFRVMTAVSKHLDLLVVGPMPGDAKMARAKAVGALLISVHDAERLISDGW